MDAIYSKIRDQALIIARRYPPADFYQTYADEVQYSADVFIQDAWIIELRDFVSATIENDFGHGMDHANKVAVDAGALIAIEGRRADCAPSRLEQLIRMAHCAGLFHDIRRKAENHALKRADSAAEVLKSLAVEPAVAADICRAIRNHEEFT